MSTLSLIEQLQEDVAARLGADPFAADLPVLLVRRGVTDSEVRQTLNTRTIKGGKQGAALIILMPERRVRSANAPGPQYDHEIIVRTLTLPKLNDAAGGTKKSAGVISEWVENLIHHFGIGPAVLNFIEAVPFVKDEDGSNGYDSSFGISEGQVPPRKAAKPRISVAGDGTVTITCATGGASIRASLDGSLPVPTGSLYTGPFPSPTGGVLRAVAYAAGYQASDVAEQDFGPATGDPNPLNPPGGDPPSQNPAVSLPAAYTPLLDGDAILIRQTRGGLTTLREIPLSAFPFLALSPDPE